METMAVAEAVTDAPARARTDWVFWLSAVWMALMIFCAVFAHLLPLPDPHAQLVGPPRQAPTLHHIMGTDVVGHDLFSQVVNGARISMLVALEPSTAA